jgi:hypothetical protein
VKIFRRRDLLTLLAMVPFTFVVVQLDEAGNWSPGLLLLVASLGMFAIGGIGFHTNWPHRRHGQRL